MSFQELVNKLNQVDIALVSKKSNVSEIILRRLRDGKESSIREETFLRLSRVLKEL